MNRALALAETMERVADHGDPNVNLATRWAEVLGVAADSPEFYSAVCAIYASFIELRHEIAESELRDRAKTLYGGALAHLIRFANPAQVSQVNLNSLQKSTDQINMLHLAADALPERLIPELQQPVIDQLYDELDAIISAAANLDTDAATKRVIEESLTTLKMVLRNYKMLGPDGAARIYGSVAAELMRTHRQDPPKAAEAKTLLQRAIGSVKKAGYAVIFAGAVVHGAEQLLTDGSDVAEIIMGDTPAIEESGDRAAEEAHTDADLEGPLRPEDIA